MTPDDSARWFSRIAQQLASEPTEPATGTAIVSRAVEVVGCDWAGLCRLSVGGRPEFTEFSDPAVAELLRDVITRTDESFTAETLTSTVPVHSADLVYETRWPNYAKMLVVETPIRSALGFRISIDEDEDDLGALTLYSGQANFFTPHIQRLAEAFANLAAVGLLTATHKDRAYHLARALESNREIGVAIGILMARHGLTDEKAFDSLRIASQHLHRKLRDVAAEVTQTGELPEVRRSE
jgi:GAF domain-containing protein